MKKITAILLIGITTLFFTACGGGGGGSTPVAPPVEPAPPPEPVDPMTERNSIGIMYNYPAELCMDSDLQEKLRNSDVRNSNFLFRVEDNNVGCGTYGKVNGANADGTEACLTRDMSDHYPYKKYDTSCVFGYDFNPDAAISTTNAEYLRETDIDEKVALLIDAALEAL